MQKMLARRLPLDAGRIGLPAHIRAPLSLNHDVPVSVVLARREAGTNDDGPASWEFVISPFDFAAWSDLWVLNLRFADRAHLTADILEILDECKIDVLSATGALTFSGENDSIAFVLDCSRYVNAIDGRNPKVRQEGVRWRMRFLETLIGARFSDRVILRADGRPMISLERLDAYSRIAQRLMYAESGRQFLGDPSQSMWRLSAAEQHERTRLVKLAFRTRMSDGGQRERSSLCGVLVPPKVQDALGEIFQTDWKSAAKKLCAMPLFEPRDMIVRALLSPGKGGADLARQVLPAAYIQVVLPRADASSATLERIFAKVGEWVQLIPKYSFRPGFEFPSEASDEGDAERARDRQRERGDLCRIDMVVVPRPNESSKELARDLRAFFQRELKCERPYPLIFTERDFGVKLPAHSWRTREGRQRAPLNPIPHDKESLLRALDDRRRAIGKEWERFRDAQHENDGIRSPENTMRKELALLSKLGLPLYRSSMFDYDRSVFLSHSFGGPISRNELVLRRAEPYLRHHGYSVRTGFERQRETFSLENITDLIARSGLFIGIWMPEDEADLFKDWQTYLKGMKSGQSKQPPGSWMPLELGIALALNKPVRILLHASVDSKWAKPVADRIYSRFHSVADPVDTKKEGVDLDEEWRALDSARGNDMIALEKPSFLEALREARIALAQQIEARIYGAANAFEHDPFGEQFGGG